MSDESELPGVEVPWQRVPAEARRRLIEEYVTRESTDSGIERTLDERVREVEAALVKGRAVLCFDPVGESFTIVERR